MKKILPLFAFICLYSNSKAQTTAIPDPNFEQALIDLGYDVGPINGSVLTSSIENITVLDINSKNIGNLTGIEHFTSLENLSCYNNQLTALNLGQNLGLKILNCNSNLLSALDVSENTNLTILSCSSNNLENIDVSNNLNLLQVYINNNELSAIDLTSNEQLNLINLSSNNLTSIDLSNNLLLINIYASNCQLTTLDVSSNTLIKQLVVPNNSVSALDVSQNLSLEKLTFSNNDLVQLDLSNNIQLKEVYLIGNQLEFLSVKNGTNENIIQFNSMNNPNLECIEVDDEAYSTANWTSIDAQTVFSEACSALNLNNLSSETLTIYPNPASNHIIIKHDQPIKKVEFYDVLGKQVLEVFTENSAIEINDLPSGVYHLKIHTANSTVFKQIVKY